MKTTAFHLSSFPARRGTVARRFARRLTVPFALLFALLAGLLPTARTEAIRFGPPRPVCDEIRRLERGGVFLEILGPDGEAEYQPVLSGRTDPVLLDEGKSYRLGLTLGRGPDARVPARYRVESRSYLTLSAYGTGEAGFPLGREFSWNAYEQIQVYARNQGRRNLYLRVSECYKGGSRFLYAPNETLVPVVVVVEEEGK
jgi:hypothetical protein